MEILSDLTALEPEDRRPPAKATLLRVCVGNADGTLYTTECRRMGVAGDEITVMPFVVPAVTKSVVAVGRPPWSTDREME